MTGLHAILSQIDLSAKHREKMKKDHTLKDKKFYFQNLIDKLDERIRSRFEATFEQPIFAIALVLDPNYGLSWIKPDKREA